MVLPRAESGVDDEYEPLSLQDAFGDLKDPRVRTPEHDLTEMLVVALAAILSGADSWVGIAFEVDPVGRTDLQLGLMCC